MEITNLVYFYGLTCLSVVSSVLIAGFVIRPSFAYFEKKYDTETARRKSLAVAVGIWLLLQVGFFVTILFFNPQVLN